VINDPGFGPVVALGLGCVLAETLNDVTYRIAPFGPEEASCMVQELRDVDSLVAVLVRESELVWALRERLVELDINRLIVKAREGGNGGGSGNLTRAISSKQIDEDFESALLQVTSPRGGVPGKRNRL